MNRRLIFVVLVGLGSGAAHASGLKAAQIVGSTGVVYLSDAPGAKERRIGPNEHPWIYHGGRVRIVSGSVTLLYANAGSKPEVVRQTRSVYRRFSPEESALMSDYGQRFGKGVRPMMGFSPILFPAAAPVPASVFVLQSRRTEPIEVRLGGDGADGLRALASDGRVDDAALRARLAQDATEGRTTVRLQVIQGGRTENVTVALSTSDDDSALGKALARDDLVDDPTLRHLGRARTFQAIGLKEFALYELIEARSIGPTYPFAEDAEKFLRAEGTNPVAPPRTTPKGSR